VNQFIEECCREWKRLRVPDLVANEMAADLEADLDEAEADGALPEEVLGRSASDPRSFAATWAAERGVIPPQPITARLSRRSLVHAAIAALTIIAAVGAGLVLFASPQAPARMAAVPIPAPPPSAMNVSFVGPGKVWVARVQAQEAENAEAHAAWLAALADFEHTFPQAHDSGVELHTVGSILLIVGIVGVILSVLLLFWSSSRRFETARS
jgi:hypothetical protein